MVDGPNKIWNEKKADEASFMSCRVPSGLVWYPMPHIAVPALTKMRRWRTYYGLVSISKAVPRNGLRGSRQWWTMEAKAASYIGDFPN